MYVDVTNNNTASWIIILVSCFSVVSIDLVINKIVLIILFMFLLHTETYKIDINKIRRIKHKYNNKVVVCTCVSKLLDFKVVQKHFLLQLLLNYFEILVV